MTTKRTRSSSRSSSTSSSTAAAPAVDVELVKTAQRFLEVPQTGTIGPATRDRLLAYQRAASLELTGDLDEATLEAMRR